MPRRTSSPTRSVRRERSHRVVVAELHRAVDVRRAGDALLEHADRFQSDRDAEARRGESGRIADDDRALAHLLRDRAHLLDRLVARSARRARSPSASSRAGIEEVQPDHPLGPLRGGAISEMLRLEVLLAPSTAFSGAERSSSAKRAALQRHALRRGLDHQLRGGERLGKIRRSGQPRERATRVGRRAPSRAPRPSPDSPARGRARPSPAWESRRRGEPGSRPSRRPARSRAPSCRRRSRSPSVLRRLSRSVVG